MYTKYCSSAHAYSSKSVLRCSRVRFSHSNLVICSKQHCPLYIELYSVEAYYLYENVPYFVYMCTLHKANVTNVHIITFVFVKLLSSLP